MDKIISVISKFLGGVVVVCLAIMVILVFSNVVLRYVFNSGITVSEELSRWLFVWLTFLGAVIALAEGTHLGSDMLVSKLGVRGKKLCFLIGHLLMLYAAWLLFRGSLDQMIINIQTSSAVMEVSMAIFYGAGGTASVLAFLILLNQLWKLATGKLSEDELIGIRESEDEPVDFSHPVK